ncbi:MAG: BT_3928 family protein, partial [Bacteroidales bacterium]
GIFILMCIFTPLTFILALTNPVSDCGCFGDAIKLTNWQTFWKNVLLMAFVIIMLFDKNKPTEFLKPLTGWSIMFSISTFFIAFTGYNLRYLPVIDFLPYKIGNNIRELMEIPEGAPAPVFKTTFIYEKEGVKKEFTIDDYPAGDTSWVFIDQKSVMIKKGYEPPIHDFSIVTTDNRDLTDQILNNRNHTLLMIITKLEKAKPERLEKGFETGRRCLEEGTDFYILTASSSEKIKEYQNDFQFCLVDEITLKTMVRSNPGYIMLKNGTVTGKWSWANLPGDTEKLRKTK